jgi:hypothetical protein
MYSMKNLVSGMLLVVICLTLVACGGSNEAAAKEAPAKVEAIEGSEYKLITLTERAAERLGIASEAVREEAVDGATKKVVPYASVIYGVHGETWAYMRNSDSLSFVRVPLTVERIEGDLAILTEGPELGTEVITVGAAELYGADTGVGK